MSKLTFAAGLLAQQSDEVYAVLLTLTHSSFASTYRFTPEPGGIVSNGQTYVYCPFDINLPNSEEGGPGETTLSIQNVNRVIGDEIRALSGDPVKCQIQVITKDDPDYVEVNLTPYELVGTAVYGHQATGTLTQRPIVESPYGRVRVLPQNSPAWFR